MKEEKSPRLTQGVSADRQGCEPGDEMLTKPELAARLKVNVRTIERWQRQGYLPYLKVTTVILFHWPSVVKHLTENFQVAGRGVVKPVAEAGRKN